MLSDQSRPLDDDQMSTGVRKGATPKARRAGPRFVFVNDRTPRRNAQCAACREPISDNYVREIATGLIYCGPDCKTGRWGLAGFASRLRAWIVL